MFGMKQVLLNNKLINIKEKQYRLVLKRKHRIPDASFFTCQFLHTYHVHQEHP